MLADEVHQSLDGFVFGNVEAHWLLADIEVDLVRCPADVAEIGVCHFTRPIHDAAHDGDLHPLEVIGAGLDACGDRLKIEERAAAARAGDVVSLEGSASGGLQNVEGQSQGLSGTGFRAHQDCVTNAIGQQGSQIHSCLQLGCLRAQSLGWCNQPVLEQDGIAAAEGCQADRQQSECRDWRDGESILDGDPLGFARRMRKIRSGVYLHQVEVFVDRLWLHIRLGGDLRSHCVEGGAFNHHADQILGTGRHLA